MIKLVNIVVWMRESDSGYEIEVLEGKEWGIRLIKIFYNYVLNFFYR